MLNLYNHSLFPSTSVDCNMELGQIVIEKWATQRGLTQR